MLIMNVVLGAVGAKEATAMDKFVDFFDKFDPVTTAFLALFNLILVFIVFRFTRKMSQSKLSISPESRNLFLAEDDFEKLNEEVENKIRIPHYAKHFEFEGEGFPIPIFDLVYNPQMISIRVKNRGDLPSTNINIVLKLKIYKSKITYDNQELEFLDVIDAKRELQITEKYHIKIPYMGADEERVYELFDVHGQIREAELILEKIKANGHTYYKQGLITRWFRPTIINHYEHPYINHLGDNNDYMKLIGHKELWKEKNEEEAEYRSPFSSEE